VRSPLAELGFTKEHIRAASRRRNLPTWIVPSSPCLSSRIPYGLEVTRDRLRRIEAAEAALRSLGIAGNVRVRHHGELARVELDGSIVESWLESHRLDLLGAAVRRAGFARVAVDLRGFRSGSLNVLEGIVG